MRDKVLALTAAFDALKGEHQALKAEHEALKAEHEAEKKRRIEAERVARQLYAKLGNIGG